MVEIGSDFRGMRQRVDEWNYETVVEHAENTWKKSRTLRATRKWL